MLERALAIASLAVASVLVLETGSVSARLLSAADPVGLRTVFWLAHGVTGAGAALCLAFWFSAGKEGVLLHGCNWLFAPLALGALFVFAVELLAGGRAGANLLQSFLVLSPFLLLPFGVTALYATLLWKRR